MKKTNIFCIGIVFSLIFMVLIPMCNADSVLDKPLTPPAGPDKTTDPPASTPDDDEEEPDEGEGEEEPEENPDEDPDEEPDEGEGEEEPGEDEGEEEPGEDEEDDEDFSKNIDKMLNIMAEDVASPGNDPFQDGSGGAYIGTWINKLLDECGFWDWWFD
jgi:hypothetical protein